MKTTKNRKDISKAVGASLNIIPNRSRINLIKSSLIRMSWLEFSTKIVNKMQVRLMPKPKMPRNEILIT
jgi:hypothetical protein